MCGIAGVWASPGPPDALRARLDAMTDSLAARGPDGRGVWLDADAGLGLGHRRLAVIDPSERGAQPMVSACGRFVLSYNGELYGFRALRAELEAEGARFRGESDSEVLLAALARRGLEPTLQRADGMFAFALWDRRQRRLTLARDRLGIKPLYWSVQGGRVFFGSELKALCAHPGFRRRLDRDALALLLRYGYVPAPHTIFRDCWKLPPGGFVVLDAPAAATPRRWWSAREVAQRGLAEPLELPEEEAEERLAGALRAAVERRMVADVPLGAFLSGGIDSSLVVALMQSLSPRPVRSFTIGFRAEGYDEAPHARAVAAALGTTHTELYVDGAHARSLIPRLPTMFDEPFADSSQLPTHLLAALARQAVTVSLSGDGGDELFGGYPRYFLGPALRRLRLLPGPARRLLAAGLAALPAGLWNRLARGPLVPSTLRAGRAGGRLHRLARLLPALDSDAELYRALTSLWQRPAALVLGAGEPPGPVDDPTVRVDDLQPWMLLVDSLGYLPDDILTKVDRATMAVGLETRVPLLDPEVFALAWRLPRAQRIGPAPGKRLLRRVLARYLPRGLFERPKMGFGVPLGAWLRGPLRDWAEELFGDLGEVFAAEAIRQVWRAHLRGDAERPHALWSVLMFQAWRREWKPELG